jgi:N-acetylglucosamine kinase
MCVLGIDAGGTKTVCLLADEHGRVIAESRGGGANLQASGELEVEKVLHDVMASVLAEHDVVPAAICLGIAGVDRPDDAAVVRGIMRRIGFRTPAIIVNDALIALVAGAGDAPGIVIVAGTGSIAYGRNRANRAARAGGWGYLFGDEGGGFWIGRAALVAAVKGFDGRAPQTQLTERVLNHMGLAQPSDLVHHLYDREAGRRMISELAAVVMTAADAGDAVAQSILAAAAAELTAAALSVVRQLELGHERFPAILAGGVLRGLRRLGDDVARRLSESAPETDVRRLDVEPACGAVHLALASFRGTLSVPQYA